MQSIHEKKYTASLITTGRIIGAFVLLLTEPLSFLFYIVYVLCCLSDILDGYVARKTGTAGRCGEVLDSVADLIFVIVVLVILIPLFTWDNWIIYWLSIIAFLRLLSLAIGYAKYRTLTSLHTHANKFTGLALVCFPVLLPVFGIKVTTFILCTVAGLSACEELIITCFSKQLNRNIRSLFAKDNNLFADF